MDNVLLEGRIWPLLFSSKTPQKNLMSSSLPDPSRLICQNKTQLNIQVCQELCEWGPHETFIWYCEIISEDTCTQSESGCICENNYSTAFRWLIRVCVDLNNTYTLWKYVFESLQCMNHFLYWCSCAPYQLCFWLVRKRLIQMVCTVFALNRMHLLHAPRAQNSPVTVSRWTSRPCRRDGR